MGKGKRKEKVKKKISFSKLLPFFRARTIVVGGGVGGG